MDTTTSAIAKRIAEARERVFPAMYRPFNCSDCRKDVRALADTLEAVTRERDEKQAVYEMTYRQLKLEEAMCDEQEAKIEAVTKERDALVERVVKFIKCWDFHDDGTIPMGHNLTVLFGGLRDIHDAALASRATPQEPNDNAK